MKCKSPRLKFLCSAFLFFAVTLPVSADELDALLNPGGATEGLIDDSATKAWGEVVDAFRRNDLEKARELGAAFLEADHRTSPYQLLGVQVMLGLANADNPTVSKNAAHDAELKQLMDERDQLRARYASLQALINKEDAVINRHTRNRTQAVQAGTQAYRECAASAAVIDQANAAMAELQPSIDANKLKVSQHEVGTTANLKNDTMKLLDMLIEAGEIEAAFAITNVYVRVAGSDLDIAKKQQDVIRLREDQQTANKIVAAIAAEVEPLAAAGKGGEAKSKLEILTARVETSGQSDSVKKMAVAKLKALGIQVASAQGAEESEQQAAAMTAVEVADRITHLEEKLEAAQESFGTTVRSIEGYAVFTGEFTKEDEKERLVATLNEKIKAGEVSKERVENVVKARAEHVGILRELDTLDELSGSLSAVQRGRLANLRATAETGHALLVQIAP
jgi:hypothetical protein